MEVFPNYCLSCCIKNYTNNIHYIHSFGQSKIAKYEEKKTINSGIIDSIDYESAMPHVTYEERSNNNNINQLF